MSTPRPGDPYPYPSDLQTGVPTPPTLPPAVAACCADPANLLVESFREYPAEGGTATVRRCVACRRRHYEMVVPMIPVGAAGAEV